MFPTAADQQQVEPILQLLPLKPPQKKKRTQGDEEVKRAGVRAQTTENHGENHGENMIEC